jgi:hypothetical protein
MNMPDQTIDKATSKDHQVTGGTEQKPRKALLGIILPPLAFCMSLVSLLLSQSAQNAVARIEAVKTEYGLFNDMSHLQLEHPLMSHLFTVTLREYGQQVSSIKAATSSLSPDERLKLALQERAVAHYTFTLYEETFLLWQQAKDGEKHRTQLLEADLRFFNDMFCTNPRLAWYWDVKTGGGLARSFAQEVRAYYNENVAGKCSLDKDAQGPFSGGKQQ